MGKWLLLVLSLGMVFSCGQEKEQIMGNPTQIDKYFPLKEFVENQVDLLDGATVRKSMHLKDQVETTELELDAEAWRKELDIFVQSDINKASLATAYDTEEKEGLTLYRLKKGEKSAIKELEISYKDNQVHQINFIAYQDDFFYKTGSTGELVIDMASGVLNSYRVTGSQKVWFLSPNEMKVEGQILR